MLAPASRTIQALMAGLLGLGGAGGSGASGSAEEGGSIDGARGAGRASGEAATRRQTAKSKGSSERSIRRERAQRQRELSLCSPVKCHASLEESVVRPMDDPRLARSG